MGTICYSLKGATYNYAGFMATTRRGAAVEIRLDSCLMDDDQIKDVFSTRRPSKLIATCHTSDDLAPEDAAELLTIAILAGTDYVDVPTYFPEPTRKWLMTLALNKGCKIIVSYHNRTFTDSYEDLEKIARSAFLEGADIVKIVTTARSEADGDTVLKLYDKFPSEQLVAFAMGEKGEDSRLVSFAKGAPLFYLSTTRKGSTASGQPQFFDFIKKEDIILQGTVKDLPSSKSYAQRAILLAALSTGTTKLYGVTLCGDVRAAIGVAESLMADVYVEGTTVTIEGRQDIAAKGLQVKGGSLFVGESALLARLLIPLCGLSRVPVTITGEKTLLSRRLDDQRKVLRSAGLKVTFTDKSYLPVTVGGRLHHIWTIIDGGKGSQTISGLMLALSQCERKTYLGINNVTSAPYLDLTVAIASFFGISDIKRVDEPQKGEEDEHIEDDEPEVFHRSYVIEAPQTIKPVQGLEIERDWSAAAMLMVAGAIMGDITLEGLDDYSPQADSVILPLMENANIDIEMKEGSISVRKSILCPFYFDVTDSPDLFAPLFLLAACAQGESVIGGVRRLRGKESDRVKTFSEEFAKLGVHSSTRGDEIFIYGVENRVFEAASCSSHGDHRLAMALYIASLRAKGEIHIDNMESVDKSFPNFVGILGKLLKKK